MIEAHNVDLVRLLLRFQEVDLLNEPLGTTLLPADDDDFMPGENTTTERSSRYDSNAMTPGVLGWQHNLQAGTQQLRAILDSPVDVQTPDQISRAETVSTSRNRLAADFAEEASPARPIVTPMATRSYVATTPLAVDPIRTASPFPTAPEVATCETPSEILKRGVDAEVQEPANAAASPSCANPQTAPTALPSTHATVQVTEKRLTKPSTASAWATAALGLLVLAVSTGVAVGPAMYRCTMQDAPTDTSVQEPLTYSFGDNLALRMGKMATCAHELSATHFGSWAAMRDWSVSSGGIQTKLEKLAAASRNQGLAWYADAQRYVLDWTAPSNVAPQEEPTNETSEALDNQADRAALEDAYAFLARARQINNGIAIADSAVEAVAEQPATIGESLQEDAEAVNVATDPGPAVQSAEEPVAATTEPISDLPTARFQYNAVDTHIGDKVELLVGTLVVIAVAGIALVILPNQSRAGTMPQQPSEEADGGTLPTGAATPKAVAPATPAHARDADAWHTPYVAAESPKLGSYFDEADTPVSR